MLPLLLRILSYGALLLLLMPPSLEGVITVLVLFALGSAWLLYRKPQIIPFWRGERRHLAFSVIFAATATFLVIQRAVSFHEQWRYSSRLKTVAGLLHTSLDTLLLVCAILLAAGALCFLYVALCLTVQWLSRPERKPLGIWGDLLACVVAAAVTVITAQIMVGVGWLSMGTVKLLWAVLIVTALILLLYCLFGKVMPAICVVSGLFMLISTINVYVYRFRERVFEPVDIFSAGTAMNVAENYSLLPIPLSLLVGWVIFLAWLYVIWRFRHGSRVKPGGKVRLILLALCAVSLVASFFYTSNLKTYHWHRQGAQYNGYILDFVSKFKELSPSEPENYSAEQIAQLAEQYSADSETSGETEQPPHIIVIMDESFADLSVVGDFSTNMEVTPFISSLTENTISGYALSSVFGGNTANSEYEFLTGNSMAWLSSNAVPYQQYLHASTYSMVSYLKDSWQYKCIAMHPYEASGWNRPAVYDYLGFDECYFLEDFPQENYVRSYVSDREMFEFLIETYEAQKDEPLFFFGVTMQNHGAYYYSGDNYTQYISLEEYDGTFPDAEQYLSLIYETDRAVAYLISYFQDVDEDVLIVFFGDHQPKVDEAFFEAISGGTADTLSEQQKRYQVPFFIWANYDIDEAYVDCTSLNYLSSYVYQAAGLTLPPYNRFLQELETVIPTINANGFYSLSRGDYLSLDEAEGEEQQWLALYEALQYNSSFDKSNRNQVFFPTPK